jgi:hypothetical protein
MVKMQGWGDAAEAQRPFREAIARAKARPSLNDAHGAPGQLGGAGLFQESSLEGVLAAWVVRCRTGLLNHLPGISRLQRTPSGAKT